MGYHSMEFNRKSVFLVTGGAGFIGSCLCEALLDLGYTVRCLDNLSLGKLKNMDVFFNNPHFTFHNGDIRDFDMCLSVCKDADYVLHQAALGSVPRSIKDPLLFEEANIKGMLNMLEAAKQNKVKRFVYASSSAVYGDEQTQPVVEGKEGNLLSPYALTKRVNEQYGRLYTDLYGLETVGLRYFNIFGRRQDPEGSYAAVIPLFIKNLLNDEAPTIFGDGRQTRDFTYIENVIEANLKALIAPANICGQAFNIACGQAEELIDIYRVICSLLGKTIEPRYAPERHGDIKYSCADISMAREKLDYQPDWNFSAGITAAVGWYKENYR